MKSCDICFHRLDSVYIDGKTIFGHWANMCEHCFYFFGTGLGLEKGQKYTKIYEKWVKEEEAHDC